MSDSATWIPSVTVLPKPDESPRGFLIRVCEENGWPSFGSFFSPIQISGADFARGDDLAQMAAAFGIAPEAMETIAAQRSGNRLWFGRERLNIEHQRLHERCVCLRCLEEERYQRIWWDLRTVAVCPRHGISFESKCGCGRPLSWTDPTLDQCPECSGQRSHVSSKTEIQSVPRFQQWQLARLGIVRDQPPPSPLDDLPLSLAIEVVEMVATLEHGDHSGAQFAHRFEELTGDLMILREEAFAKINTNGLIPIVKRMAKAFREHSGLAAPRRPLEVLGWYEDMLIRQLPGRKYQFETLLLDALSQAIGFPITHIDVVDYVSIQELAWDLRMTVGELCHCLAASTFTGSCLGEGKAMFVPKAVAHEISKDWIFTLPKMRKLRSPRRMRSKGVSTAHTGRQA